MTSIATSANERDGWPYLFFAWIVALAATLSALFIGEVMGQAPCSLCWHQRAFMFPLALVLAVASFRSSDRSVWLYALPLAGAGWLVAVFHSLLYAGLVPEQIQACSQGPSCASAEMTILGGVPLPFLSLAAFTAIAALLIIAKRKATP